MKVISSMECERSAVVSSKILRKLFADIHKDILTFLTLQNRKFP